MTLIVEKLSELMDEKKMTYVLSSSNHKVQKVGANVQLEAYHLFENFVCKFSSASLTRSLIPLGWPVPGYSYIDNMELFAFF